MTYAAVDVVPSDGTRGAVATLPLWRMFCVALIGVLLISLPNLLDPMIRHDDYPAFFADPSGFWAKTLHEGRWLNYVWHLRGQVTPAWLNYAVYQMLWALFAGAFTVATLRRGKPDLVSGTMALLVIVSPSAALISLWFNTLLPGLALVALYAVLGCTLSVRAHRALLPVFTVATFMAYTTYPLLLVAVCLLRTERRSLRDLFLLCTLFVASFAVAVLLTYTLNWQVHGVFGVPLAEWRDASPASDLSGMIANLSLVPNAFGNFLMRSSFDFAPAAYFHVIMFGAATIILLRRAPLEALYLHMGLWMGIGLIVLQIAKLGVDVPPRTFIFVWVFYAAALGRALMLVQAEGGVQARVARNLVLLIVGSYLLQVFQQNATYRDWQAETRALGDATRGQGETVVVYGDVLDLTSARQAFVQNERALGSRLQMLTGQKVIFCGREALLCAADQDHVIGVDVAQTRSGTYLRIK